MATKEEVAVEGAFGRKILEEPNWVTGDLRSYPCGPFSPTISQSSPTHSSHHKPGEAVEPLQQSDLLKPFLVDIANYGLTYAYHKYKRDDPSCYKHKKTNKPKHVIVVGAGMAGLVAAYELAQAGHNVTILEQQMRFGGRVKTFGEKDGFAKDLHVDAGAMRLPCHKVHFLTDHYVAHFQLELVPFVNYDENTFLKFYNMEAVQVKDWKSSYFDALWPGWDAKIKKSGAQEKYKIKDIGSYYKVTTDVVMDQLRQWLAPETTEKGAARIWQRWIQIWSQFPLDGFLRSTCKAVLTKVPKEWRDGLCEKLQELLPWPEEAIRAYSVFSYTLQLDQSLVQYLREQLGVWWSNDMQHIKGGMSQLPEAFTKRNKHGWNKDVHIYRNISFNRTVNEVEYTFHKGSPVENQVKVKGYFTTSGQCFEIEGDAVIVTTPINILRQIRFTKADCKTKDPPQQFYKAIEDIWTGPSTKIMIQTKTRFWESKYNIRGGFSKTNLPIGQIHYPSNPDGKSIRGKKGILLVYTWKSEALLFGSLDPQVAVKEAVRQIACIHPEIENEFEVGAVEAWYNEPASQGAYVLLKPHQFHNVEWLTQPWCNVYFAGEGISFTAEWIQGALESGLRAAYQFYARNENYA